MQWANVMVEHVNPATCGARTRLLAAPGMDSYRFSHVDVAYGRQQMAGWVPLIDKGISAGGQSLVSQFLSGAKHNDGRLPIQGLKIGE